jgi:small subunit ribosomal protein S1
MVTKPIHRTENGGPPPLDESWWEAVLTEDEAQYVHAQRRGLSPPVGNQRATPLRKPQESNQVDWEYAQSLYLQDQVCMLLVTGFNRGGLLVAGDHLHGFVPVSHLVELAGEKPESEQRDALASYVDRTLHLKIIECDEQRGRVVFSERAAQAASGSRNQLLERLYPGQCVRGNVTNITDFGVFIDLGGVEGLIHVSEISWGRVRHPGDVLQYGQEVQVHVISIDSDRSRVALSLKRMYANPWETAEQRYKVGQIVDAVITSMVPFGAFARLEEGLDGLIHISELGEDLGDARPDDLLVEGQPVRARILHVDAMRQRLGLSLRLDG